jgi:hypothetical protein
MITSGEIDRPSAAHAVGTGKDLERAHRCMPWVAFTRSFLRRPPPAPTDATAYLSEGSTAAATASSASRFPVLSPARKKGSGLSLSCAYDLFRRSRECSSPIIIPSKLLLGEHNLGDHPCHGSGGRGKRGPGR